MSIDPFELWLGWEPGQPFSGDVLPLAEALLAQVQPTTALTLWLADAAGGQIEQGLTVRMSGPPYARRPPPIVSLRTASRAEASIWQRAAQQSRSVRQLEQSRFLLARRLQVGSRLLGLVAVADPDHDPGLARRLAHAATWAAPALMAFRLAERRTVEYGFWRASAQIAQAYAASESLERPFMPRAIASAVRNGLQVDRCLLLELSVPDNQIIGHYVAGIRHLWPNADHRLTSDQFLSRLADQKSGQAAEGLVLWTRLVEDDGHRLTPVADNLISEVPLPPLVPSRMAGNQPGDDGILATVARIRCHALSSRTG